MSRLFYGSICITDLMQHLKEKHSAFTKGRNGKIYVNINRWLNDEPDEYGHVISIKLAATKEAIEADPEQGKIYIGNCKESDNVSKPVNDREAERTVEQFNSIMDDSPF